MEPTFVFDDNGTAYAYVDGKIIAAAQDADTLEDKLAMYPTVTSPGAPSPHGGMPGPDNFAEGMELGPDEGGACPTCQSPIGPGDQFCAQCGTPQTPEPQGADPAAPGEAVDPLPAASPDTLPGDDLPPRATHITTPGGLKGQLLGRVKGLWGDQVTIRLENGRIAKFDVTSDTKVEYHEEKIEHHSPLAALQARLNEVPSGTKKSLQARVAELKAIKREAQNFFRQASYADELTINNIIVHADHELREVADAIAGLEEAEAYAPPAPFSPGVVEQESLGGNDGSWLDEVAESIASENEAHDFDQMIEDQPALMVADMPPEVLADPDAVAEEASDYVTSKTAGLVGPIDEFRAAFLARVENCRVAELQRLAEEDEEENDDEEDKEGEFPFQKDSSVDTDDSLFW